MVRGDALHASVVRQKAPGLSSCTKSSASSVKSSSPGLSECLLENAWCEMPSPALEVYPASLLTVAMHS